MNTMSPEAYNAWKLQLGGCWPEPNEDETLTGYISRCFIPRPQFKNGTPVQFGDQIAVPGTTDSDERQEVLTGYTVYADRSILIGCTGNWTTLRPGERVRRWGDGYLLDARGELISTGDTVYIDPEYFDKCGNRDCNSHSLFGVFPGKPYTVLRIDRNLTVGPVVVFAENSAWCRSSWLVHEFPEMLTCDADGVPVKEGDIVWTVRDGIRYTVKAMCIKRVNRNGDVDYKCWLYCDSVPGNVRPIVDATVVTHKEPDSQEKIDAVARVADYQSYWKCEYVDDCQYCPSQVDGKDPSDRYGVVSCESAMIHDLLRRQRELDAREAKKNA